MLRYCSNCQCETEELSGACSMCARPYVSTSSMSVSEKFAVKADRLRIILVGHGTYCETDGTFRLPASTSVYFRCGHGESTGGHNTSEYRSRETLHQLQPCFEYRLWPLVGERQVFQLTEALPYHHAHHPEHRMKLTPGKLLIMYSQRSGDGPRLSTIIQRVNELAPPAITIEFLWLACREVIQNNYVQQSCMRFDIDPVTLK